MFTPSQWDQLETIESVSIYLGIPLIATMLLVYLNDRDKRGQYLVICFGCISLALTITSAIMHSIPFELRFCRNNANLIAASDGISYCAVQSFVNIYGSLALCLCWLIQSVGVYIKIALGWRNLPRCFWLHMCLIFGLPLISVAVLANSGQFGYSWAATQCTFSPVVRESGLDVAVYFGPVAAMCAVGVFCMCSVIAKIAHVIPTSTRTGEYAARSAAMDASRDSTENEAALGDIEESGTNTGMLVPAGGNELVSTPRAFLAPGTHGSSQDPVPGRVGGGVWGYSFRSQIQLAGLRTLWEILVFLRTPLLFLSFFLFVYVSVIAVGLIARSWYPPIIASFNNWAECAVRTAATQTGDGSGDAWMDTCGEAPARPIPMALRGYLTIVFSGQSVFVALIYSPGVCSWLHRTLGGLCCSADVYHRCRHTLKAAYEPEYISSEVAQSFVSFNIDPQDMDAKPQLASNNSPCSLYSLRSMRSDATTVGGAAPYFAGWGSPLPRPGGTGRPMLAFSSSRSPSRSPVYSPVRSGRLRVSTFSPAFSPQAPARAAQPGNKQPEQYFSPTHALSKGPGFFSPSRAHVRVGPAPAPCVVPSLELIEEQGESCKTVASANIKAEAEAGVDKEAEAGVDKEAEARVDKEVGAGVDKEVGADAEATVSERTTGSISISSMRLPASMVAGPVDESDEATAPRGDLGERVDEVEGFEIPPDSASPARIWS